MDDQSKFRDPEEMISCPYEAAHTLPRHRLAIHLTKCRKQHAELANDMKTCTFNIQHIIPRVEYEYHLENCSDRDSHHLTNFKIGEESSDCLPELMKNLQIPVQLDYANEENWDDESGGADLLATIQKGAREKILLENYSNEIPSIRKALRMANRIKTREKLNKQEIQEFKRKKAEFIQKSSSKRDDNDNDDKTSVVSVDSLKSCCSSIGSDISYKTAMTSTLNRLQSFPEIDKTKTSNRGRGRSGRVLLTTPNLKLGIGRSRRLLQN